MIIYPLKYSTNLFHFYIWRCANNLYTPKWAMHHLATNSGYINPVFGSLKKKYKALEMLISLFCWAKHILVYDYNN